MSKKKFSKILVSILLVGVLALGGGFLCGYLRHNVKVETVEIKDNQAKTTDTVIGDFDLNEESLESESFEESNPELAGATNEDEKNTEELVSGLSQDVYYSQIDSRWKNHPYTITGSRSQTIGTSGCGPTSAAMCVSTIKGVVYPNQMGDLYVSHGFRTANNGTYTSAFKWTANYYGIGFQSTYNLDTAINLVRNNYMVVVSCGKGLFTTGGHYIVITGIEGDTLKIYDPFLYAGKFNSYGRRGKVSVQGNTVYCSIFNFRNFANSTGYFGFLRTGNAPVNPQPSPTPNTPSTNPTYTYTMYVNTSSKPLNIRYSPNGNVVGSLARSTAVTVYSTSGNWSEIGTNRWVSSSYLSSSKPSTTTYTSSKSSTGIIYNIRTALNVRRGPGKSYSVVSHKYNGNYVTIYKTSNGWAKIGNNQWVSLSYVKYTNSKPSTTTTSKSSSVGKYRYLKTKTYLYSKSNLSGTRYTYLPGTKVKINRHISSTVDYVYVVKTGRNAYIRVSAYK